MEVFPTKIDETNWGHAHFRSKNKKAFISIGAEPSLSSPEGMITLYLITVTDKDDQELFQSSHEILENALEEVNKRYGHWEFKDALNPNHIDGCTTCSNN